MCCVRSNERTRHSGAIQEFHVFFPYGTNVSGIICNTSSNDQQYSKSMRVFILNRTCVFNFNISPQLARRKLQVASIRLGVFKALQQNHHSQFLIIIKHLQVSILNICH